MRKQFLRLAYALSLGLCATLAHAQPFSNAITALNPVAYWPLNESATPPATPTGTNLGSLGSTLDGVFHGDVTFGIPGALSGTTADGLEGTGFMQSPYSSAASTAPSFTIEAWLLAHDTNGGDTECALSDFSGTRSGWLLYVNINGGGQYNFRTYDGVDTAASINLNLSNPGSIAKDTWYHVVVVVSNSITATNVYGYINGVLMTNGAVGGLGFHPNDGASGGFAVGERSDGGFPFKGGVAEVAYYPTALDANTIQAHYTAGTTAPTTYATAVEAGNPLLYFPMGEPNNLPVAHNYGSLGAVANGYYQYGVVPGAAGPSFGPFPNGFGASDLACQFSPSGLENNTNPGPGVVCGTSNLAALDDETSITVSAWVQVPKGAVGWFTGVLGRGDSSYRMAIDTDGAPHFADGGGGNGDIVGSGPVNDGNWHYWVGSYNSANSNAALYIDSQLVGTATWNPPGGNTEIEFYIGGAPDYDGRNFVGSIAQVAVFDQALTSGQIQTVFGSTAPSAFELAVSDLAPAAYWPLQETTQPPAATTPVEVNLGSSGASQNGVVSGDVIFGAPGALASTSDTADVFSVAGGGATSLIQSPFSTDTTTGPSFTIEAWLNSYIPGFTTQCPLSDMDANSPRSGWLIYQDISAPGLYTFRAYDTNGTTQSLSMNLGAAGSIAANQWYHVVVVVSNAITVTNVYGYINGTLVAGPVVLPTYVPSDGGSGGFSIGARTDGGFHFSGGIDEVAYYPSALDGATVLSHYQAGTNPSPATAYETQVMAKNPILYYRMDEAAPYAVYPGGLPVAVNYGTTGSNANGYYQPGLIPGIPGPTNSGMGPNSLSVSIDPSFMDSTAQSGPGVLCDPYDFNALNPTNALTLTAWVQVTNVGWFESVVGRSDSSYRFSIDTTGLPHFAAAPNGDVVGTTSVQDSLWHFWEGVYDPVAGTGTLYIDGIPVATSPWNAPNSMEEYFLIGGAPDYNNRNFSGNIAHVAIFTNALTVAQSESLYGSVGVGPLAVVPTNQIFVNQGGNGSIIAAASGTAPLSEQWYFVNASGTFAATNGTSETLNFSDVGEGQNTWLYEFVVSNAYGVATSAPVELNVVQGPPTIQTDVTPPLSFAPVGVSDVVSVSVTGSQPFFFHWYLNGAVVPGATNSTYNFSVLTGSNTYNAQISNAFGPVISSSAAVVGLTGAPSVIGFTNTADWTTNNAGIAEQVPELSPTMLQLTDGTNGEVSSAWYNVPQYIGGFIAKYTFLALPGNASIADGSSFTIQNDGLTAVAGGGGDLGIYGLHDLASFITDLYNITGGGIGFSTNGQTGGGTAPVLTYLPTTPVGIELGDPINIRLYFSQGMLYVFMQDPVKGTVFQDSHYYGDLVSIVGGASAYVGFTGSTGGVASIQQISNFEFSSTTPPVLSLTNGAAGSLTLSWPVSVSTMFSLQQSASVTGPWQPLTGVTVVNGQNQVTVAATGTTAKFYQLVLQ